MATNSVMGGIMQLVNLCIVFVIWFPFLKALDKLNMAKEKEAEAQQQVRDDSVSM
jgi:PTS system cellobiose-specific IIC component